MKTLAEAVDRGGWQVEVCVSVEEKSCLGEEKQNGKWDVVWLKRCDNMGGEEERRVGLTSVLVAERMKWEQERVGWAGGGEYQEKRHVVRVDRKEEFRGTSAGGPNLDAIYWWRDLMHALCRVWISSTPTGLDVNRNE
ncbi:hypothetical protein FNV43_RR26757 [Rhamnella rubrinervis]|uniref:Uncharacterized protein n=1 Tax=Rhamnella rubrinervis TaxID=2594499 RepID=A0A8K0DPW7_9ROSA|nr:hypothetical protein FNV43_RR26757 [Rhamnella rubrinervis]